jgi:peptidoglycan/LPS O-acetylase OafA/YrhL
LIRLGDHTPGRDNNTQLLRLLAATGVIAFHSRALSGAWSDHPLFRLNGDGNLGSLGVSCFFVLSGFLVTQSWQRRPHLLAFLSARALRIYPGLVVAVMLSIFLAGLSSKIPWDSFLTDPMTIAFARHNALGWRIEYYLPGAFNTNIYPNAVNGSLWTLGVELRLYVGVAVLGFCGILARRRLWAATLVALVALFIAEPQWFPRSIRDSRGGEVALLFALGSLAYVWRERIALSLVVVTVGVATYLWNAGGIVRGAWVSVFIAYSVLVLAYHPRVQLPRLNRGGDYSYGLYVYAFPVQQIIMFHALKLTPVELFVQSFIATLGLAAVSWHFLEHPMLSLKSRFHT